MSDTRKETFDNIYQQYNAMVLQVCIGFMKGDTVQANDLLQEIFINTWNALPHYRGEASYKTWLYRITVNTCLQHIRKQKNKIDASLEDVAQLPADNTATYTSEAYASLYHAIGQLAEVDRLIIMMVLDEMGYGEICSVIGINEVNLRVKIHRIKSRLKKIMNHE